MEKLSISKNITNLSFGHSLYNCKSECWSVLQTETVRVGQSQFFHKLSLKSCLYQDQNSFKLEEYGKNTVIFLELFL